MSCVNVGELADAGAWARGLTVTALRSAMDAMKRRVWLLLSDGIEVLVASQIDFILDERR